MPQRRIPRHPKYRKHKPTGQAVVTISGKDFYLGPHRSKASIAEYDRLIAEWLASGRRPLHETEDGITITELIAAYWKHVQNHYVKNGQPTSEQHSIKSSLKFVRQLYGRTQAEEFGPLALKAVRQKMIDAGWIRVSINRHVGRVRHMFKWGAANELLPASVWQGLQAVSGLQSGRSEAAESKPVGTVPDAFVDAIREHIASQVWAMIELQRCTGARPGEVCIMRVCDLDMSGPVWIFRPETHKTVHRGREREIYLGPRAQGIVREFLTTDTQAYLFSPREAEAERHADMRRRRKSRVQPSQQDRRKRKPRWKPRDRYDTGSYRRAITRAVNKENERRQEAGVVEMVPQWAPNRLRHNAGTQARKHGGLELAQALLGHAEANVTQVYAERDRERAIAFVAKHG